MVRLVAVAAESPPEWLVGKRFDQRLHQKSDLTCANSSLGATLKNLATGNHLAIVLDRRIDPNQTLSLTIASQPLEDVLRRVAETEGVGLSLWEPIVYLGPPQDAAALRTLAWLRREEVAALPAPRRQALLAVRPWSWDESGHSARPGPSTGRRSPSEDRGTRPEYRTTCGQPGDCRRWPGSIA